MIGGCTLGYGVQPWVMKYIRVFRVIVLLDISDGLVGFRSIELLDNVGCEGRCLACVYQKSFYSLMNAVMFSLFKVKS